MGIRRWGHRFWAVAITTVFISTLMTPIAGAAPAGAKLEFIAGGFDAEVMALVQPTGDDRGFVVERKGFIHIIEADGNVPSTPFLNVDPIAQSLNGLVFHPNFENNRQFYVYTVESSKTRIVEYKADANNPNVADTSTRRIVLERPRQSNDHKGGQMEFGADGYLYMSLGDDGPPPGDPNENGQDITTIDGSIIRIDHVTGDGHPDNPFVGVPGDDAIWIYGFRHPWRFSFDDATGLMYIGDVGDAAREEIDVVAPDQGGDNFGWDVMEGTRCFEPPQGNEAPCGDPSYTMPDLEYTHDEGCAVIGGYVYHGTQIPQMQNRYFYADYCEGYIKSFQYVNGNVTNEEDWTSVLGAVPLVTSFGEANDGELYLATDGDVYKIVPDGPPPQVGTIEGTVWSDDNENGLQNGGEGGISGVTVELWIDSDSDGSPDIEVDSQTTDGSGDYSYPGLAITSDYVIKVEAPVGKTPTLQDVGGDDTVDSDVDPASGFTAAITLSDGEVDDTVDAGLVDAPVGTIAGRSWRDEDGDGIQDAGESGFAGLYAWLYTDDDLDGTPDTKVDTFFSGASGQWTFDVDPAKTYYIEMGQQIFLQEEVELVLPNRTEWSPQDQGGDDTVDSDVNAATSYAGPITVVDGEVNDTIGGGFVPLPAGYADLVADDGAVAYWRLGELGGNTALDSARTNDGTIVGNTGWGEPGMVGDSDTSMRFDGSTFIDVPDSTDINKGGPFEARTVEAWFIVDDTAQTQIIFEEGSTSRGLSIYVDSGSVYGGIWNRTNNGDGTTPWPTTPFLSAPVNAGLPYHVVLAYSFANDSVALYLNGSLAESTSGVGRWFGHGGDIGVGAMNQGTRLHTGGRNSGDQFYYSGILDEVAVYPTALSAAQVFSHFGGEPTNQAPTVNAGSDQSIMLPASATLNGTVNDDGLPNPPGSLTTTWSKISGPGTVTFGNPSAVDTSASFSTDGEYVLRLTADDGEFAISDTVTVTVVPQGTASYSDEVLADNPVAYWRLSESGGSTVTDETGNNDGNVEGSPNRGVAGLVSGDTAYRLDGADDWYSVPDTTDINLGGPFEERTVELWFQADDDQKRQVLYEEGAPSRGMSMYIDDGFVYTAMWNRSNNGDGTTPWSGTYAVMAPVSAGNVYHVAAVYDFSTSSLQLYVNGGLADTATGLGRWFAHGGDIGVGAMNFSTRFHANGQQGGNIRAFDGVLDEVAVYGTALSAARIGAHYAAR
ncbi:MAG: hypothetical protein HKN91_02420 [Acidimicrobiia bacterium]|nr:hypothetical protein [Acidimicrobiia bacterium]